MSEEKTISVDYDEVIEKHSKWASEEASAASDAGERRQAIGAFAESTGVENKALSQFRAGMKIKNEGKQRDWLRSWKALLPIAESHITGNSPEMELTPAEDDDPEEVVPFQRSADG